MLNWADLSSLLVAISGLIGGIIAARGHNAEAGAIVLFAVGGLSLGFGLGVVSRILSYFILFTGTKIAARLRRLAFLVEWATILAYMVSPMVFICAAAPAPAWIAKMIYGF